MWWILAIVAGGLVMGFIVAAFRVQGGVDAFVGLGEIRGRPIKDLISVVGAPTSVSAAGAGQTLYQWIVTTQSGGYHYAILVDAEENAVGYTHQFTK